MGPWPGRNYTEPVPGVKKCVLTASRAAPTFPAHDGSVPEWRNGRRGGLKIHCPRGREGSIPSSGTTRSLRLSRSELAWQLPAIAGSSRRAGSEKARSVLPQTPEGLLTLFQACAYALSQMAN